MWLAEKLDWKGLIEFTLSKYVYSLSSNILHLTVLYPKWFLPAEIPA